MNSLLSLAALGLDLEVSLVQKVSECEWQVESPELASQGIAAVIRDVPREKAIPGGRARGWIGQVDAERQEIVLFTRDRGRLPISDGQRAKYRLALTTVLAVARGERRDEAAKDDLSEFKGMLNRSIRHDQPDWLSVYDLFGRPPMRLLQLGVAAVTQIRASLSNVLEISSDTARLLEQLATRALNTLDADRQRLPNARTAAPSPLATVDGPERVQVEADAAKTRLARRLHGETLEALRQLLEAVGYVVEENVHVDAYARLRTGPAIFEVKSLSDTNEVAQVREALSQLYEYRFRYEPSAALWLVLSRPLSPVNAWMLDYLRVDRGVAVLWLTSDGSIEGPWKARLTETKHAATKRAEDDAGRG